MDLQALEDLKKLRVVDLKERLSKLGKSTSGLKADLVARLHGAIAEQSGNVDLGQHSSGLAGYSQVEELPELQPMNPEPPVVEVTIDTSQFECGVVEPQIVNIEQYPIVENVGEVTIPTLHMDQISEHDMDLYYQQQQQQQEEAERIQAMLHRQQQEAEMQRQQEEVERQRLLHEQILLQRQQEEDAELQRQREIEEQQRLEQEERQRMEQEERARWQQEEEYRRMQEAENLRREQEAQLLLAQEKAKAEERLRCQQLEEEQRRRKQAELEEAERQRQELERVRWQQEEGFRQMQEAEMLRLKQEMEDRLEREQKEAERARQEYEEAERVRREQEEADRIRQEQKAERIRQEEAEQIRMQQEEAELIRRQEEEAELIRRQQEAERIRQEQEEAERRRQAHEEAERIRRQQEEAERIRREREAEKIRWEQEEAERIRSEQEAERLRMEQEETERLRREHEEAERIRREREEADRIKREQDEANRIKREREEAERIKREQEEADRIKREREEEAERIKREREEAERIRQEREEAERIRQEKEAERIRQEREEAERMRQEREEAERMRQEREEAERMRQQREEAARIRQEREEAERLRREEDEQRKKREHEEAGRLRLEKEEAEKFKREQVEAERKRLELEKAERLKREKEEAEKRRLQQEEKLRKEQETVERQRKEREEAERLRREREKKRMEEEEGRLKKKRLEEEEKERLHQEYLDKQTAAALIQIPVQVPVHSGPPPKHEGMPYQPMMHGMGQPWNPVSQPGFPPPMVIPPPVGMGEAHPGYNNVPHYHGEMSSPPHSSSPPPIPGLGPPSPSQGKADLAKPPSLMSLDLHRPLEDGQDDDMRLPQALEKVLAYKMERAQMLGVDPDTIAAVEPLDEETAKEAEDEGIEMEDASSVANKKLVGKSLEPKPSKNKQRKLKKKKRARHRRDIEHIREIGMEEETGETEPDVEVQYIEDSLDLNPTDPMYHHFMKIFEAFKLTDPEIARKEAEEEANRLKLEAKKEPDLRKKPKDADEDLEEDLSKKEEQPKLSKRKLKKLNRLSIAELKQHVNRPDVVEMHDVTAKDPRLLVILKSTRNTVPVPRHWCFKRKFLQGKRGIEKPPFDLPDFIKKTGIMEMRQALQEKEDQKTLKAKMRERVRPKMGKIDIDYQKLHDAFFKWQTKPKMTIHGDLYYEGKEFETRLKEKKPGELSDDLRTALGMPVGPNSQKVPPPWLIAMQRYGPPPSYPNLKIPGLNSPIPDSCSFGYHAGGWGKPPVDEMGKPLYGDVFGIQGDHQQPLPEEEVDRTLWGELESESESESEEEDDEEEEEEEDEMELEDVDKSGFVTPAEGGLVTPSGISSIPMGMETPDMIELRKRKIESEMEGGETPALYTILPEKKTDRLGSAMMGSTHIYDIAAAVPGRPRLGGINTVEGGVDVALDPSELDLDAATMTARYEQTLREQQNQLEKEDLSDMVAEHSAKQKNKRKRAAGEQHTGRAVKKYKDFKF